MSAHPAQAYVGRFAPSPTGALHAGSLIAAMASFLDARAHAGRWLLRIEDVDEARTVPGADQAIIALLAQLGMQWDGEIIWQSQRKAEYEAAGLRLTGHTYACACSRREVADSSLGAGADGAPVYPGTCRAGLPPGRSGRCLRLRVPDAGAAPICFTDRWQGRQCQHLASEVGDFVLKRVEGYWAYQMAVVVDDGLQGVTDVVRGVDLLASTARQIWLQNLLGLPPVRYLHFPVLCNADGEKLSKQTGASAVTLGQDEASRVRALQEAARFLELEIEAESLSGFWQAACGAWAARWGIRT